MKRAFGLHPTAYDHRASVAARELMGSRWWFRRRAEIAALPTRQWKGRTLYDVPCNGVRGKGPHVVALTAGQCWHLLSLGHYVCPYHDGDQWTAGEVK